MGALTAAIALLLYTGHGFLRTTGMLLGITIAALAAGVWAGDDGSRSTRWRAFGLVAVLLVAAFYAAGWSSSPSLRDTMYGGSLAVLLLLALPSYATGSLLAGLERHGGSGQRPGVPALAGAAIGIFVVTTFLVPDIEAYSVFFAAAALMVPSALMPIAREDDTAETGGIMRDRVAIITGVGATGQLGYAVAQRFVAAGARIVVVGLTDDIRALATQLGERDRVIGVRADLTRPSDVDGVIRATSAFGRLDALVNIAGGLTVTGTIEDTTPEQFQSEMRINAETALTMSRAALPLLRAGQGAIVNFASPAGEQAIAGLGAYSAAKAAVIAITQSLALEEAVHGVRVNAIAPGMIDTEQNRASSSPNARFVSRDQVADVVLFLVSEAASGVSGETVHVRG